MIPSKPPLLFAAVDYRHKGRVFGIRPEDLLRHVHIIGKTGSGKTALMERLLVAQIRAGEGCGLLDPHGDLAARVLDLVPAARTNDVVFFNPSDVAFPPGVNLLDAATSDSRSLVVAGVLSVFKKVFQDHWGPRLEHVFRNCLYALLDVRGATLLGVMRMLVDEPFRASVVARVRDPVVRFYWTHEWTLYPRSFLAEVIAPVQNKVGAVLTDPVLRNILGQPTSTIACGTIMDAGQIFVADLAKGRIGEDASALLGALLVTRFQLAAYARATLLPAARRPFTLYIDEVASFVTPSFAELLAEARKYGLALVVAHQYLGQLDPALGLALLGNAGTLMTFRVGAEDALDLGREFAPELTAADLTRLDRYQIALRLMVDGRQTVPFTAVTLPPFGATERVGRGDLIRRVARERYGRDRARVEAQILTQLKPFRGR